MLSFVRAGYSDLLTSAVHLLILVAAFQANDRRAWLGAWALVAAISFFAWMASFRRGRAIADTPTSRIASAAQGYTELYGRATAVTENLVRAKQGSLPCVWFRCVTYRKNSQNKWEVIERAVSDSVFEIEDGTGKCLVDPDHAEVVGSHRRTWYENHYKHVEDQLFANDNIYVLGEFSTLGGAHQPLDHQEDMRALLAEWKQRPAVLLERFDLNGDGRIDMQEWELARKAAAREVEKHHRELCLRSGVHVIRKPKSGRLFLMSNLSPQQLRRKYLGWSWFHLAMLFTGIGAVTWLMLPQAQRGLGAVLW